MAVVLENLGSWLVAPYADNTATFGRLEPDGSLTVWSAFAQSQCWVDPDTAQMRSSKHPWYLRIDNATGLVLNCYEDIWKLVPHGCTVLAVDEFVPTDTRWVDGELLPPLPPPEQFAPLTRRQFSTVLALDGIIPYAEALDWAATGKPPTILNAVLDQIADERAAFLAKTDLAAASQFERYHDMVPFIAHALSTPEKQYTPAVLDDIWRRGAKL